MTDEVQQSAFAAMTGRIEAAVELEQMTAACRVMTPELLNGLALNCDWLLRRYTTMKQS